MVICVWIEIFGCIYYDGCKQCVYNGVIRDLNIQFYIDRICERIVCQCDCIGYVICFFFVCICVVLEICGGCIVQGYYRFVKLEFILIQGDWRMLCICQCDNYYMCDCVKVEYIGDELDDFYFYQMCRLCSVDGKVYLIKLKFF